MYVREGDIHWKTASLASEAVATPASTARSSQRPALPQISLLGVRLHAITEPQCIEHILNGLSEGRGGVVVTPNLDHLRRARRDVSFGAVIAEADLAVADGMPLIWASRLQRTPLPQRVAGSDLISSLSGAAAERGKSVFLLGGDPGTAIAAAGILRDRYPQLNIAGTFCPDHGFENEPVKLQSIVTLLNAAKPDIVYVGLGSPKQEHLIEQLRRVLPSAWWLGVGVSFSFLCGEVRRAPQWMRRFGLEWLHRLIQEPRRLFKRYVLVGMPFALGLLVRSAIAGIRRRPQLDTTIQTDYQSQSSPMQRDLPPNDQPPNPPPQNLTPPRSAMPQRQNEPSPAGVSLENGRLRGLILLGGSVRPGALATAIGRSVMDLPTGTGATVLTRWLDQAAEVAKTVGLEYLPVRLLVDQQAIEPRSAPPNMNGACRVERDTSEYRGTGGLLANLAVDYQDDDLILVANAAQVLLEPLPALLSALRATGGAISLVAHGDGTPSGMMLVTCRTLRLIPSVGFVDMKEQALPAIASHYDVRVLKCRRSTGLPVRSLSDYVAAVRALHRPSDDRLADEPLAEDWRSSFAIVEPGATVAPSARVQDSVVLAGATVEAGAVLVRSVVVGGATVRRDRKAVDQCVAAEKV